MAFTKENAKLYSQQAHQKRWHSGLPPEPKQNSEALPLGMPDATFRDRAKDRAREHMTKLQDKIDAVLDAKDLDVKAMRDLADAVLKLESVEQKLSGRPGPGTLKPTAPKTKTPYPDHSPQFSLMHEPAQVTPQPVVVETPADRPQDQAPRVVVEGEWSNVLF